MRPEGLSLKNSSDSIGNRSRDLPVCSSVPQPTAPPRTPGPVLVPILISCPVGILGLRVRCYRLGIKSTR
jgi:hypothetical protein